MNDERHICVETEVLIPGVVVRGLEVYHRDIPRVGEVPRAWRVRVCLLILHSNIHRNNNDINSNKHLLRIAMQCQSRNIRVIVQKVSQRWRVGRKPGVVVVTNEDEAALLIIVSHDTTKIWEGREILEVDLDTVIIIQQQQQSIEMPAAVAGGYEEGSRTGIRVTHIP